MAENAVTVKKLSRLGKSFLCQYLFISLYLLLYIQTLIRSCQIPAIYRGYYTAALRYEISLRVFKNISRVSAAN